MDIGLLKIIKTTFFIWLILVSASVVAQTVRVIPDTNGKPVKVSIRMQVIDIDSISTPNQLFTANVYYQAKWMDKRLAHSGPGDVIKPLDDVWNPNLQFVNQQRLWQTFPNVVEISPQGEVTYSQRVFGSFAQPLNLYRFPFDIQDFTIRLVAAGYSPSKIELNLDTRIRSGIARKFSVPDWDVLAWSIGPRTYQLFKGGPIVAGVDFKITAKRYIMYYILKFVIPLLLIVIMSMMVYWIDVGETSTRISVSVTSMLTLIAFRFVIDSVLPKVPYLTRLDIFILASTFLVFASLLITAITAIYVCNDRKNSALKIVAWCRWIIPLMLLGVMVLPFLIYP